jgi:hypothetical protein
MLHEGREGLPKRDRVSREFALHMRSNEGSKALRMCLLHATADPMRLLLENSEPLYEQPKRIHLIGVQGVGSKVHYVIAYVANLA